VGLGQRNGRRRLRGARALGAPVRGSEAAATSTVATYLHAHGDRLELGLHSVVLGDVVPHADQALCHDLDGLVLVVLRHFLHFHNKLFFLALQAHAFSVYVPNRPVNLALVLAKELLRSLLLAKDVQKAHDACLCLLCSNLLTTTTALAQGQLKARFVGPGLRVLGGSAAGYLVILFVVH